MIKRISSKNHSLFYSPFILSTLATNSLENKPLGVKANRLYGRALSLKEAQTLRTTTGSPSSKRIIVGLDEYHMLVLIDGRHLLEGYRMLGKDIPEKVIHFNSQEAKNLFTSSIKGLKI